MASRAGLVEAAGEIAGFYRRIASTRAYDLVSRLPAVAWHLACANAQLGALLVLLAGPPKTHAGLLVASRVLSGLVFLSFAILCLIRRPAVRRSVGIVPRLVGLLGSTIFGLIAFLPAADLPLGLHALSLGLMCIGGALTLYSVWHLGRAVSLLPEARRLVTSGPYRHIRHPLYLFEALAILGVALQFASVTAFALLVAHLGLQLLRIRYEERVLGSAFPDYAAYAATTWRLIPGLY
jgi:protein-S-isoprenylcysteine O-methyltransferase Ste14